jgi:hypothetical protein
LLIFASALQFYGINLYPLYGDKYGSILDSQQLGRNWNSIIYSSLMHFWIRLGSSEMLFRIPSAIFGVFVVLVMYKIGGKLEGKKLALITGVLSATSPFLIYHAQQFRFYSFFILATSLFILSCLYLFKNKKSIFAKSTALISAVVLIFSHFFGIIAVLTQSTATFFAMRTRYFRYKYLFIAILIFLIIFSLLSLPGVTKMLWQFHKSYNIGRQSTPQITHFSIFNILKPTFTAYIFIFGYNFYPFSNIATIVIFCSGLCLGLFLFFRGATGLIQKNSFWTLPIIYVLVIVGIYAFLDPIIGRIATGLSPRHVAFMWPVFILCIAIGICSLPKKFFYLAIIAVIMVNFSALWLRWMKQSGYNYYREAIAFASSHSNGRTALINDGRSEGMVNFYFRQKIPRISLWQCLQRSEQTDLLNYEKIIFMVNDFQPASRASANQFLRILDKDFYWMDSYVDYPLFVYIFRRKEQQTSFYDINQETGQIYQPFDIYGLELQDLRLPINVSIDGVSIALAGAFMVSNSKDNRERQIQLTQVTDCNSIVIASNVISAKHLFNGQQVAQLLVESDTGIVYTFPLRLATETNNWHKPALGCESCKLAYAWQKRIAFLGQSKYPQAWQDFQAGIYSTQFKLPSSIRVKKLSFTYTAHEGSLYIWAIALKK